MVNLINITIYILGSSIITILWFALKHDPIKKQISTAAMNCLSAEKMIDNLSFEKQLKLTPALKKMRIELIAALNLPDYDLSKLDKYQSRCEVSRLTPSK